VKPYLFTLGGTHLAQSGRGKAHLGYVMAVSLRPASQVHKTPPEVLLGPSFPTSLLVGDSRWSPTDVWLL